MEPDRAALCLDVRAVAPDARERVIAHVRAVYRWIDGRVDRAARSAEDNGCRACGRCCDFEAYDHRLFVTAPELLYFMSTLTPENLRAMPDGVCPYRAGARCAVYEHRFAGCRIFGCRGPLGVAEQAALTERALRCFKAIGHHYGLPYVYTDLKTALKGLHQACKP
ncbi:MAG TPA: hypothetical protein ENN87_12180 [Phycisphaerales bacterium]|nr:hypothetical protein [Phycisphaerales bacterium]